MCTLETSSHILALIALFGASQCLLWCVQCLEVQVFSIRAAATDNLAKLAQEFGPDWAQEHLVPQVGSACLHPVEFVQDDTGDHCLLH